MFRIGLFATGRGQGSLQLVTAVRDAIEEGRLPARVEFVFSNREPGEFEPTDRFFEAVRGFGYPLVTRSFRRFKAALGDDSDGWRVKYDREVIELLAPHAPDLCVLAGYLLIFSPALCERYTAINLHPAAPGGPVGMWQEVIWRLIETGAPSSGNMMQSVIPEVDRGPIVTYSTFPIAGGEFEPLWDEVKGRSVEELRGGPGESLPLFRAVRGAGTARERPLVVETLRAFAEGRVRVEGGAVVDGQGRPIEGLDLTAEIEAGLRGPG